MNKPVAHLALFLASLLFGCSPASTTLYKYRYDPSLAVKTTGPAKVYLAPFDLLLKQQLPLAATAPVTSSLADYVTRNGYQVLPQQQFVETWEKNAKAIGGLFDPENGEYLRPKFDECLRLTLAELREQQDFSYVLLPGLVVKPVPLKRYSDIGEWDGVRRELPREKVFQNGWRKAQAASLLVSVVTRDNDLLFRSLGGLDFVQVSTREGRDYVLKRRDNPFADRDNVAEGIGIALHPFIEFAGYPARQEI